MAEKHLEVNVAIMNNIPVLQLKGELVMDSLDQVRSSLNELIRKGYGDYVFDFKEVNLVDSIVLGFLYTTCDNLRKFEKDIKLSAMSPEIQKIVKAVGMLPFFQVYETTSQAVAGIKRRNPIRRATIEDNLMVYQTDRQAKDKMDRKPRQFLFDEDFHTVEASVTGGITEKMRVVERDNPDIVCADPPGSVIASRTLVGMKIRIALDEVNVEFIPTTVRREANQIFIEVPPTIEIVPRRVHQRVDLNLVARFTILNLGKSSDIKPAVTENLSYSGISLMIRNEEIKENDVLGIEVEDDRPTPPARMLSKVVAVNRIAKDITQVHCAFFLYNLDTKRRLAWLMKDIEMLNQL